MPPRWGVDAAGAGGCGKVIVSDCVRLKDKIKRNCVKIILKCASEWMNNAYVYYSLFSVVLMISNEKTLTNISVE